MERRRGDHDIFGSHTAALCLASQLVASETAGLDGVPSDPSGLDVYVDVPCQTVRASVVAT